MTKSRRRIPDTGASPLAVGPPHPQPTTDPVAGRQAVRLDGRFLRVALTLNRNPALETPLRGPLIGTERPCVPDWSAADHS
jgi:hypothetical protein